MKNCNGKYYVYGHFTNNDELFYIGRGTGRRKDSLNHRSEYWFNVANKHGWKSKIIIDGINNNQANKYEKMFIVHYGRRDNKTGCLVNLTDGGDGLTGYIPSKTTLLKKSLAIKGRIIREVDSSIVDEYMKEGESLVSISKKFKIAIATAMKHIPKPLRGKKRVENGKKNKYRLIGNIPWNKGYGEYMVGSKNHFYGKKHNQMTRDIMSIKKEQYYGSKNKIIANLSENK